jgi:hypothetical protein
MRVENSSQSSQTLQARASERKHASSNSGQSAVWQARLILLVMINVAQLWVLAATVEAALAGRLAMLTPLVVASGVCFVITLSLLLRWRPVSRRHTSTGYVRERRR